MSGAALVVGCLLSTVPTGAAATAGRAASIANAPAHPAIWHVANPPHNIAAKPDFRPVCAARGRNDPRCISQELAAIRHARRVDGVKRTRMLLPHNYRTLTVAEQTFVISDLERVARGLRPFQGLAARLNRISHLAAAANADPVVPDVLQRLLGVEISGSVWAEDLGPLASLYDWMYDDGYSRRHGTNLACRKPHQWGCWAHRDILLGTYLHLPTLLAGAGTARPAGQSISEVLVGAPNQAAAPKLSYSWRQALAHGANGHGTHRGA